MYLEATNFLNYDFLTLFDILSWTYNSQNGPMENSKNKFPHFFFFGKNNKISKSWEL